MAEVINRTRKEAKAKISKVCYKIIYFLLYACIMSLILVCLHGTDITRPQHACSTLYMYVWIFTGNRTEWSPIWSAIIHCTVYAVIDKIGSQLMRLKSDILLITRQYMITDRTGWHKPMLPIVINHNYNVHVHHSVWQNLS